MSWSILTLFLCSCLDVCHGFRLLKSHTFDARSKANASSSCTTQNNDPYRTGGFVQCCDGLQKTKTTSSSGRHHYVCTPAACTSEDQDPYQSGSLLQCCTGLTKMLGKWNGRDHHYLCRRAPAGKTPLDGEPELRLMSYNLFGYNAFNKNKWRGKNIVKKIAEFEPAVLGAQEVEQGAGVPGGHAYVRAKLEMGGKYTYAGENIFYLASVVEKQAEGGIWVDKSKGRRMGWVKFSVLSTGREFLFFNTHWHNKGSDDYWFGNARTCAAEIDRLRRSFGDAPLPSILVGDFNVKTKGGTGSKPIRYLTGQEVDGRKSPVKLVDAIPNAPKRWGNVIDYILHTQENWLVVSSETDMDGFGRSDGWASDHGALKATMQILP